MKHFLLLACLLGCLAVQSCQCSNKPDVGPVEGDEEAAHVEAAAPRAFV